MSVMAPLCQPAAARSTGDHRAWATHVAVLRKLLTVGRTHRLRASLITAGIAVGIVAVAFGGGVLSGKLQHVPTYHGTGSLPPVMTTTAPPPPTTIAPADSSAVAKVHTDVIADMTLDVASQRLDPSRARRAALAETSAAVATRHADIAAAWAPDKVPIIEREYDQLVELNARNQNSPSVTADQFIVTTWSAVTIDGNKATAVMLGHYQLTEPGVPTVEQPDAVFQIALTLSAGHWRMEERTTS
jgi:hypothetical protein